MFFPKEHRKKMQESTFRPLLHRFCFLHLSITQKERAYWLKRNKLIGPGLILYSPDRRKRGKRFNTLVLPGRIQLPFTFLMAEQ